MMYTNGSYSPPHTTRINRSVEGRSLFDNASSDMTMPDGVTLSHSSSSEDSGTDDYQFQQQYPSSTYEPYTNNYYGGNGYATTSATSSKPKKVMIKRRSSLSLLDGLFTIVALCMIFMTRQYGASVQELRRELEVVQKEAAEKLMELKTARSTLEDLQNKSNTLDLAQQSLVRSIREVEESHIRDPFIQPHAMGVTPRGGLYQAAPVATSGSTAFYIDTYNLPDPERERRENALQYQRDALKKEIQTISKREMEERYGKGPHFVEFIVKFQDDKKPDERFVVETAPHDLVPHSVLVFLEMVDQKLWDNTAFVHHEDHVVTATATDYFTGESQIDKFQKLGLDQLAFPEYSPEFPHVEYTLGFAGRPGGPEFYISTSDNTKRHGPGSKPEADLVEEADPCFARVVDGFQVVDRLYQKGAETPEDVNIVAILTARILPYKYDV